MSNNVNELLALANEASADGVDMNEAVSGGGGGRLLPVGTAFAVLVGVVQIGRHPQEYNGKPKDPADEVQLTFALFGTGHNGEKYQNDDGTPYIFEQWPMAMSRNEKARAFKLFGRMNWRKTAKDFPQLLNGMWLLPIKQKPKSATDPTLKSYGDFDAIAPAVDPLSGQPYAVPTIAPETFKLFLWERPTVQCWNSLYVDGKWDDGETKNRTQGHIVSALNFEGSGVQNMLLMNNLPIPAPVSRQRTAKPAAGVPGAGAGISAPPSALAAPAAPPVPPPAAVAAPVGSSVGAAVATPPSPTVNAAPAVVAHPGSLNPLEHAAAPASVAVANQSPPIGQVGGPTYAAPATTYPSNQFAAPGLPGLPQ